MRHLDNDYIEEIMARLRSLPEDALPRWGQLRKDSLIRHFIWTLRHAMGRSRQVPYIGNFLTRRIAGPLLLNGIVPFPRNLKLPKHITDTGATMQEPGDLETLHALLEEYVALVQADELRPALHPVFGAIGVDGWDKLHVRHFEHHFRQFGI